MLAKLGVDDWLGRHPRRSRHRALLDLIVRGPADGEAPGLTRFVDLSTRRRDQGDSLRRFYAATGREADEHGIFAYRREPLALAAGMSKETLDRRRDDAVAAGVLERLTDVEVGSDGSDVWSVAPLYRMPLDLVAPRLVSTLGEWLKRPIVT